MRGTENEGALKMIEAKICEEKLQEAECIQATCNNICQLKHGNLAGGTCESFLKCICSYPC